MAMSLTHLERCFPLTLNLQSLQKKKKWCIGVLSSIIDFLPLEDETAFFSSFLLFLFLLVVLERLLSVRTNRFPCRCTSSTPFFCLCRATCPTEKKKERYISHSAATTIGERGKEQQETGKGEKAKKIWASCFSPQNHQERCNDSKCKPCNLQRDVSCRGLRWRATVLNCRYHSAADDGRLQGRAS